MIEARFAVVAETDLFASLRVAASGVIGYLLAGVISIGAFCDSLIGTQSA